jgi:hypothetical protein
MTEVKPGGRLYALPQELVEEIYRNVFFEKYVLHYPAYTRPMETPIEELAILRASKTISTDAMMAFYSKSTFRYAINMNSSTTQLLQARKATEKMKKVQFDVSAYHPRLSLADFGYEMSCFKYENVANSEIYRGVLDQFGGTHIIRDTMTFKIEIMDYNIATFLETPVFQTLKGFQGFKIITIEVRSRYFWALMDAFILEKARQYCENAMQDIQRQLEAELGPSVNRDVETDDTFYAGDLIFHPQDYMEQRNRVKKT